MRVQNTASSSFLFFSFFPHLSSLFLTPPLQHPRKQHHQAGRADSASAQRGRLDVARRWRHATFYTTYRKRWRRDAKWLRGRICEWLLHSALRNACNFSIYSFSGGVRLPAILAAIATAARHAGRCRAALAGIYFFAQFFHTENEMLFLRGRKRKIRVRCCHVRKIRSQPTSDTYT